MNRTLWKVCGGLGAVLAAAILPGEASRQTPWWDTFYQYRIELAVEAPQAGWVRVPVTAQALVEAINGIEEMDFDSRWFDFNHLKVVETEAGRPREVQAGFYLWPLSENLIEEQALGTRDLVSIEAEAGAHYLLSYSAQGAGSSPARRYNPTFPIGHRLRRDANYMSHEPLMLPQALTRRERLMLSDGRPLELELGGRFARGLREISLRQVEIGFLAHVEKAGKQHWTLYYQPHNGHHLTVPGLRASAAAPAQAQVIRLGEVEKYEGSTRYRLSSPSGLTVWFAETTVKLTPGTQAPQASRGGVRISSAAREAQSFQLVVQPQKAWRFEGIQATHLENGRHRIGGSQIGFEQVAFVPINRPSYITPWAFTGSLGDPLTAVQPGDRRPEEGNLVLWVTIRTPAQTPAGLYRGWLEILGPGKPVRIPLELEVYDFELPEFSPFVSSFGGAHIGKPTFRGEKSIADYHHVSGKDDLKRLARRYYDVMAANKMTPHSVVQFSEIGMKWSPPPRGYNVDAPGNFFRLYDWDFTEFNRDLKHYIDDLKVNAFVLVHTNPSVVHTFKHLPGEELEVYERHPSHVSLAWQAFRKMTLVGYDKREGDDFLEITRAQYDRLLLDFYRTIAQNLERHGWLDKALILMDETARRGYEPLLHFLRLLKSDPLTARIRVAWCLQGAEAYRYRSQPDQDFAFRDLLDIYVPETNENHHWWERYYFTDYGLDFRREKLWNYVTYTTRVAIDSPGVNNRAIALETFNNGGGGFLNWASFIWDSKNHAEMVTDNPWQDPYTRWGNGAISYFYPPRREGPALQADWTIVPSLRVMTYREGVDDFEYAFLLEKAVAEAAARGADTSPARAVLRDVERFFFSTVHWSQNDAWYLELRNRMAEAIVQLSKGR